MLIYLPRLPLTTRYCEELHYTLHYYEEKKIVIFIYLPFTLNYYQEKSSYVC